MSKDKENEIRFRLKVLSQIEPQKQASENAIEKVRETLLNTQKQPKGVGVKILRTVFCFQTLKFATAAVILIGIGFIAGRLVTPAQPEINMEDLHKYVDKQCAEMAEKTLAASCTLMDQQRGEIIGLIEAARQNDRRWIAAGFEKIETDRKSDRNSIIALAARTSQIRND